MENVGATEPGVGHSEDAAMDAGPARRCFVTRRIASRESLIRFVRGPDDRVHPDIAADLPGRGLWLSADRDVVNTACAKRLFAKGFRANVQVDADLADRTEQLMARRCLDLLGLARRAGDAAVGFEKARGLLAAGGGGLLVVAADAGADGTRKLTAYDRGLGVVTVFTAAELSAAMGREHVVYIALRKGRLARRFGTEVGRLTGFRQVNQEPSNDLDE